MYKLSIKVPVYQFNCIVIISSDIEKIIDSYFRKYKIDDGMDDLEVHGLAVKTNTVHEYLLFYSIDSTTSNVISHEISHLIDYVFEDRKIEKNGDEARAYLTGYITEKIFDFVLKNNLLISKWTNSVQKNKEPKRLKRKPKEEVLVLNQSSDLQENKK